MKDVIAREVGAIWVETWIDGDEVEIECASMDEARIWADRSWRSGCSGWAICTQTCISRKAIETRSRGKTYAQVQIQQALEGRISHRAAGIPPGAFVQPTLIAALLRAKDAP